MEIILIQDKNEIITFITMAPSFTDATDNKQIASNIKPQYNANVKTKR